MTDYIKEKLAYLRVLIGIAIITDFSLIGWFFTHINDISVPQVPFMALAFIVINATIIYFDRKIEDLILDLKEQK
jgi:Na+/alanine symporter